MSGVKQPERTHCAGRGPDGSARSAEQQRIIDEISRLIVEIKAERRQAVRPEARLQSEIGLASVDIIDLVLAAEDTFNITIPDDETGDLMDATVVELAERVQQLCGR
ncbi:MAG: acyl carrier protein [Acidobacteriota bacterium]